ncbi:MAG: DUF192 domain-containing protein [Gemmatimonadetes bacterium]|nr:DUF192 domain-containing protein [Gemmatimonadota bacterium]
MRFEKASAAHLLLVVALLVAPACGREAEEPERVGPAVEFQTERVRIVTEADTFPLTVELAETETQRAYGLMERDSLSGDEGMLFLFDEIRDPGAGFWMWRTRIPLDIAFLDEAGRIVAIQSMEPCESADPRWCPSYAPGAPYASALEVPRGWFEERGVGVGDRVARPETDGPMPSAPSRR